MNVPMLVSRVASVLTAAGVIVASVAQPAGALPQPRWDDRTVYVQSSLPKSFQVGKAIEAWDNRSRLNLVLVKKCPKGKQCIRFYAGRRPGHTVATATRWMLRNRIVSCTVEVDTRRFTSNRMRLSTAAHETGHCLGFAHTDSKHDPMYHYNSAARPWKPVASQYRALQRIYGK